jgi:hypothetical protein
LRPQFGRRNGVLSKYGRGRDEPRQHPAGKSGGKNRGESQFVIHSAHTSIQAIMEVSSKTFPAYGRKEKI